jgi:hypothetical protein
MQRPILSHLTRSRRPAEKTLRSTVALTAARGRGKSAALGLAVAGALALGYSNIFVTAPSPENLRTLFEFVFKGLDELEYKVRYGLAALGGTVLGHAACSELCAASWVAQSAHMLLHACVSAWPQSPASLPSPLSPLSFPPPPPPPPPTHTHPHPHPHITPSPHTHTGAH